MATHKLEEKVQQHDEVVESSKTGCRSQLRAHGKAYEQVPALICDTYARRILCAATIWGGYFALYEQNNPPKYLGNKSEIPHLNFTTPPHNFGLQHQVRKPPSKPIVSLWSCGSSFMFAKMLSNADKITRGRSEESFCGSKKQSHLRPNLLKPQIFQTSSSSIKLRWTGVMYPGSKWFLLALDSKLSLSTLPGVVSALTRKSILPADVIDVY